MAKIPIIEDKNKKTASSLYLIRATSEVMPPTTMLNIPNKDGIILVTYMAKLSALIAQTPFASQVLESIIAAIAPIIITKKNPNTTNQKEIFPNLVFGIKRTMANSGFLCL